MKAIKEYPGAEYIISELTYGKSFTPQEIEDLKNKTAEDLWKELGDVPIDDKEDIDEDWYSFKRGTCIFDIWSWFEEMFNLSVAIDLMHLEDGF